MTGPIHLENFQPTAVQQSRAEALTGEVEKKLLEAYEHGHKAGWDDAVQAQTKEYTKISADFAKNIQDMSFTYHEVQAHIMRSIEPLLREMVMRVLPVAAAETLGQTILDALRPMTEGALDTPVELVLHPDNRPKVAPLLEASMSLPLTVVEEETLGSGQIFIRLGQSEKSIDMEEVLSAVSQAIEAYFAVSNDAVLDTAIPFESEMSHAG